MLQSPTNSTCHSPSPRVGLLLDPDACPRHPCWYATHTTAHAALPVLTETWARRHSPDKGLFYIASPSSSAVAACGRAICVPFRHLSISTARNSSAKTDNREGAMRVELGEHHRSVFGMQPLRVNIFSAPELPEAALSARRLDCDVLPAHVYDDPDTERPPLPYEFERRRRQCVHPHIGAKARQQSGTGGKRK
ncbi:hypothetical protein K438DRAFT_1975413 [Mycena galopus ATCC 62051]|nr:hypothetical protein K438DRAFT_1975413 [Mycena galopus ATCC 62051]